MSNATVEQLTDPSFVEGLASMSLDEIRTKRNQCQDAEETLSLKRRMVQGRLDIVQADLYRRSGGGQQLDPDDIVGSLTEILTDRGDRHLGPGRLTSVDPEDTTIGPDYDQFVARLDEIVSGTDLTDLGEKDEQWVRSVADQLEQLERSVSEQRHVLHRHIDKFQAEVIRRYKSGEASVDNLLTD